VKRIKRYKEFLENAVATASASAGMGAVTAAQPGAVAGTSGIEGSGDIGFTFKKEKRKKGDPSQVTDLRDLKDVKTNKVEDIKESYRLTEEENSLVEDCLSELIDMDFEINKVNTDSEDQEYDIDDDTQGNFKSQEIRISLFKQVEKLWRGNLQLRYSFDKNEVYKKNISTLRPNRELEDYESKIVDVAEEASYKLINHLEYTSGDLMVEFLVAGSAMPYGKLRDISVNIHIILRRNFYPVDEKNLQENIQRIKSMMEINESKDDKKMEKYIISGKKFKNKYATDFNGKVAKVFYTQNLNIGSNLGKGSYWNVTQDSLDIYSGERDEELDSKYGDYVKDIVYKEIDDNLRIFVKDEIADELWDNEKLYNKIKNISDGIYDPVFDDYGLLLF